MFEQGHTPGALPWTFLPGEPGFRLCPALPRISGHEPPPGTPRIDRDALRLVDLESANRSTFPPEPPLLLGVLCVSAREEAFQDKNLSHTEPRRHEGGTAEREWCAQHTLHGTVAGNRKQFATGGEHIPSSCVRRTCGARRDAEAQGMALLISACPQRPCVSARDPLVGALYFFSVISVPPW